MNPIEKLNEIYESIKNSSEVDDNQVEWALKRVKQIVSRYIGNDSIRLTEIDKIINRIKNSILGYNDYYLSQIKGIIDIIIDEIEFNNHFEKVDSFKKNSENIDKTKVFIVHGHDDSLKNEIARFIDKLGLQAVILHEQTSESKTIIEKIEKFSNVGYGIVLYSPCDIGSKYGEENKLKPRARQNVVFEHGYLIGKIGRENVSAIVKGDIEKPNDISGVVYISYANQWKIDIIRELQSRGFIVNKESIFN